MARANRTRAWLGLRSLAMAFVLTMPVWAAAPNSGAARQYETFEESAREISDRKTRLRWTRELDPQQTTFANVTCPPGMRLPTLKELLTIFDEEPHPQYSGTQYEQRYVDRSAFGRSDLNGVERTPEGVFWTSSFATQGTSRVWTVDFATGLVESTQTSAQGYARCVTKF